MHFHNLKLERGSPPKNPDCVSFPENLLIMICFYMRQSQVFCSCKRPYEKMSLGKQLFLFL
uniref:Uncharacterized protein n=1 Tax=Anguilla anguilla TaxID=7936 RepID=A0A0E9PAQ5_ANGAN